MQMIEDALETIPTFECCCQLMLDALAPLSMVAKMPGKFYRSQPEPTQEMIDGLRGEEQSGFCMAEVK